MFVDCPEHCTACTFNTNSATMTCDTGGCSSGYVLVDGLCQGEEAPFTSQTRHHRLSPQAISTTYWSNTSPPPLPTGHLYHLLVKHVTTASPHRPSLPPTGETRHHRISPQAISTLPLVFEFINLFLVAIEQLGEI